MRAFEVFVSFFAIDKISSACTKMSGGMAQLQKQADATQKQLDKFKALAATGAAITGVGVAMSGALLSAVNSAGRLQLSLTSVRSSMKMTNAEFERAANLAQTVGIPTIFSAEDVGGIMKTMQQAGMHKEQIMNQKTLQQMVDFADVQVISKGENKDEVVNSAVTMANMLQVPMSKMGHFLDLYNATLVNTKNTASEFNTQLKQFAPGAHRMGMSDDDILATNLWMTRIGFGKGRGGTAMASVLQRGYLTGEKKHDEALYEGGFVKNGQSIFKDKNGMTVDVPTLMKIMQDFNDRFKGNLNKMEPIMHAAFGTNAQKLLDIATGKGAGGTFGTAQKDIHSADKVVEMQHKFNDTWQGVTRQLETTFLDIWQNFGRAALPALSDAARYLANMAGEVLKFTQTHPELMKMIAGFAEIVTAVALIGGTVLTGVGTIGWVLTSGIFVSGATAIGTALTAAAWPVAALGAAFWLLYENWDKICALWKAATDLLKSAWKSDLFGIKTFTLDIFTDLKKGFGELKTSWDGITAGISKAWNDSFGGVIKDLKQAQATIEFIQSLVPKQTGVPAEVQKLMGQVINNPQQVIDQVNRQNAAAPTWQERAAHGVMQAKNLFGLAGGTNFWSGGPVMVGERGPELVNLPRGSSVTPNNKLGGGAPTINIVVHQQPFQSQRELVDMLKRELAISLRNASYGSPNAVLTQF